MSLNRRGFLSGLTLSGGGLFLSGCNVPVRRNNTSKSALIEHKKPEQIEVTATEDLMREHGVLRRALFVYSEIAPRLRRNPSDVPPDALQKTAKLFRTFGEDYHEKKLEEAFIFPAVKKAGGDAAVLPDILIAQHQRGREITDYILAVTQAEKLDSGNSEKLAQVLRSFVRMYRPHAAREDTIIFPAWKMTMTAEQLDEMNDKFEDIEHEMFGQDGFEHAVKQIADIETELGLADLAKFTAAAPSAI
jgi:hemerythrin-like domain-containing protein